jgi:HK97 family phage major capsid protein
MNNLRELRQRKDGKIKEAEALNALAEKEDRDLTSEEQVQYEAIITESRTLDSRIKRLETLEVENRAIETAPAHNKIKLGDTEERAMAHFFRTGDTGGVSHLVEGKHVVLNLPLLESRAVTNSTMNITTDADGKYAVPVGFVSDVVLRKNEMSLIPRLNLRRVPGKGTTVNYPIDGANPELWPTANEQSDAGDVAYERDAGALGQKAFTLVKKARRVELTMELLEDEDIGIMDYVADRMARQIAMTHNNMLITEVGSNGTALKTFASATAIAAGEVEDIVYNDTLSYYLDDGNGIAWVMRPTTFGKVVSIRGDARLYSETPTGQRFARTLEGYPVFYSNQVTAMQASAKDIYFGNWNYVGYREAPDLRLIVNPYRVPGLIILEYEFRAVFGVLQAGAVGYGVHPSA